MLDTRSYWNLTHGYSFATRWLGSVSAGRDPQVFRVGGFSTLRGFSNYDLLGSRVAIASTEIRFPFIQQLGVVGPLPLGFFNLRGAAFCDAGVIWPADQRLRWEPLHTAAPPQNGYAIGFGTGVRSAVAFMLLKLDVAWSTDLKGASRPRWYFSIGPEF